MEKLEWTEEERQAVLKSFFKDGVLMQMPAQHKKQVIVLHEFANLFEKGKTYSEFEITRILKPLCDDYCTIRRGLVELGIFERKEGIYTVIGE